MGESTIQIHFRQLEDAECPACACGVEASHAAAEDEHALARVLGQIYACAAMSAMAQTFALKSEVYRWVETFCEPHRTLMRALGERIIGECPEESMAVSMVETMMSARLFGADANDDGAGHERH